MRFLVFLSPSTLSHTNSKTNIIIMHATEAGKDTELSPIMELTPKQPSNASPMPNGTYIQDRTMRLPLERPI